MIPDSTFLQSEDIEKRVSEVSSDYEKAMTEPDEK